MAECLLTQKLIFDQGEAGLPGTPGSIGQKGEKGQPVSHMQQNTIGTKGVVQKCIKRCVHILFPYKCMFL